MKTAHLEWTQTQKNRWEATDMVNRTYVIEQDAKAVEECLKATSGFGDPKGLAADHPYILYMVRNGVRVVIEDRPDMFKEYRIHSIAPRAFKGRDVRYLMWQAVSESISQISAYAYLALATNPNFVNKLQRFLEQFGNDETSAT